MPNQDRAFGMPLNSFLFGVSWILLLAGTTLTLAARRGGAIAR